MENVNGRIKKPSVGECVRGAGMADAPPPERTTRPVSNSFHSSLAESGGFIQEQDLQWFNDSFSGLGRVSGGGGGTEGTPHWELMARNLDANLAELDIDTFRAEDINAVLTLPPICNADFQLQESHRGEMYASVSGSMMARFDLDSSISARSSSMEEEEESASTDMSICRSEPLFSPMREVQPVSFSVDSLDCDGLNDQSITITCQANPYNYTIAFQGSFTTTDSESKRNASTGTPTSGASSSGVWDERPLSPTTNQRSLTQSDHPFTTWSKLKRTYELRRQGTGNNNGSSGNSSTMSNPGTGGTKSQSLPNLNRRSTIINKPLTTVKLFDMQRSSQMRSSDIDKNVSLVKLFMQHRHSNSEDSGSDWHMHSDSGTGHSDSGTGSGYEVSSPLPMDPNCRVKDKCVSTVGRYMAPNSCNPFIRHVNCCNLNEEPAVSLEDSLMDRGQGFKKQLVDVILEEGTTTPTERSPLRHTPCHHSWNNNNNKSSVCSYQSHSCGSSCISNFSCASHGSTASRDGYVCKRNTACLKHCASTQVPVHVIDRCVQTAQQDTVYDSFDMAFSNVHSSPLKEIKPTHVAKDKRKAVYVCYPNYSLPDLTFLRKPEHLDVNYYLVPQKLRPRASTPIPRDNHEGNGTSCRDRPYSCDDIEAIKNTSMSHIKDWESLQTLLPPEVKDILGDIGGTTTTTVGSDHCCRTRHRYAATDNNPPSRPHSCDCAHARSPLNFEFRGSDNSINSCQKSSGYKGSSTLLSDSCGPVSPCQDYVYQYESDSDIEGSSSVSKKLSKEGEELYRKYASDRCMTPRPPLPKGILRKESCKVHKRFSMQEFRTTIRHERLHKRRSLQDSYEQLSQKIARSLSRESCKVGGAARSHSADSQTRTDAMADQMNIIDAGSGIFGSLGNRRRGRISRRELNKAEREEPQQAWTADTEHSQQGPLECSSHSYPVFGGESDSAEGEEQDTSTHREQVSALLSSKGRLDKLASLLGVVNPYGELTSLLNSGGFRSIDNVSGSNCECHCTCGEALKAKKTVSFAEIVSVKNGDAGASPWEQTSKDDTHVCHCPHHNPPELRHSQSAPVVCHLSPDGSPVAFDISQKIALVEGVGKAVDRILYQLAGREAYLLDGSINSEAAQLAFDHLCPSLYTLLSDGLSPTITGLFGTVRNSVWKVIESSSQLGPSTKALGDLVLRINSEEQLPEGPMKFNAFIAGLLNIQSLSSWMAYMRTRETVIQKHYSQSGFLYLCNTSMREKFDELLTSLNALGAIKWRLDLLFEYKRLHQSLQLMEQRLLQHGSFHEPNSPKDSSSLRNSGDSPPSRSPSLKGYPDDLRYMMNPKECLSGESAPRATPEQRRPRSLVEHAPGFSLQELATSVKKRWSGIHFGSKLISALDRLILEDIPSHSESEDYSDSIENPNCREMRNRADSNSTMEDLPDDDEEHSKNVQAGRRPQSPSPQNSKGAKFRHLQRKWELITGSGSGSGTSTVTQAAPAGPVQTRSRLPRPVTSPTRPLRAFRLHSDKKEVSARPTKPPVPEKNKEALKRPPMKINLKNRETDREKVHTGKTKLTPEAEKNSPVDGEKVEKSPSPMSLSSSSGRSSGSSKCSPQSSTMVGAKRPLVKLANTPPSSPRKTFIPRAPRKLATGRQESEAATKRTPVHPRRETIRTTSPVTDDNANSTQAELRQRRKLESKIPEKKVRKLQTLHHHLATESGHLSFTRGQELTLILEVDEDWLLCCHGNQRGLVPRKAVLQRN